MPKYTITTALPFFLHLKDGTYRTIYQKSEYLIKTTKQWTKNAFGSVKIDSFDDDPHKVRFGTEFTTPSFSGELSDFNETYTAENMEFINDDTDHFCRTIIEILWESDKDYLTDNEDSPGSITKSLLLELTKVVNQFIEKYRISSGEYFKPLIKSIPYRNFANIINLDTGKALVHYNISIQTAKYPISSTKHEFFKNLLIDEGFLTSTQLSLNSSKYWHSISQYRNSIIEAIIALEPIIYSAVKKKWRRQGLSETKIKSQLSKVDLNHLITIEISQLINLNDQIENEVFTNVLEAVGLRNKIVHRNLMSISESQSENVITNIEKMIQLLKMEEKAHA